LRHENFISEDSENAFWLSSDGGNGIGGISVGGDQGGEIVAQDTPKDIAEAARSHTARYLKKYFGKIGR